MLEYLLTLATAPSAWAALVTLIAMEVVLGIDNLIFISILTNKLPVEQRERGPSHRYRLRFGASPHLAGHNRDHRSADATRH